MTIHRGAAIFLFAVAVLLPRISLADNLASGASIQLDAINPQAAMLITDESNLYLLDLDTGKSSLVVKSKLTWFAVDRRWQTVLVAAHDDEGSELTVYHVDHGALKLLAQKHIPMGVGELQSIKSQIEPTFLLSGIPSMHRRDKNELHPWVHLAITVSPAGVLATHPLPGLSEISDMLSVGSIGFAGDSDGTFAYAGLASPLSQIALKDVIKPSANSQDSQCLFFIVTSGKVKHAWPVSFPSPRGGKVIGFTPDGQTLLAWLHLGNDMFAPQTDPYQLISVATGKITVWPLSTTDEVLAVDPTLTRAITISYADVPPATTAPAGNPPAASKTLFQANLIQKDKPPMKVLEVIGDTATTEVAATFIDNKFYMTDGHMLASVDDHDAVRSIPINNQ